MAWSDSIVQRLFAHLRPDFQACFWSKYFSVFFLFFNWNKSNIRRLSCSNMGPLTSSERRKQGFDAVSLQNNLFHSRPVGCRWNVCLNNWRERGRRQMENLLHRILNTKLPSGKQKKRLINYFRWQIMYGLIIIRDGEISTLSILINLKGWISWYIATDGLIEYLLYLLIYWWLKIRGSISFLIKLNDQIFYYGFITGWVGKGELAKTGGVPWCTISGMSLCRTYCLAISPSGTTIVFLYLSSNVIQQ